MMREVEWAYSRPPSNRRFGGGAAAELLVEGKAAALTSGTTAFDAIDTSLPN